MEDKKSDVNKKSNGSLNVNLSAGDNKIKYYECNKDNCIFEILDDDNKKKDEPIGFEEVKCDNNDQHTEDEFKFIDDDSCKCDEKSFEIKNGKITVKSIIDYGKKEVLSGVKINLYKINGLSPVLIQSDSTDKSGEVVFDNIKDGSYRVIEIVDKRYFEKPKYIDWNEITINGKNKEENILVINKIKSFRS
ncbi:MAG: prealbumin-like fold domain-containing protein [Clostridium sp.]|nr:prealbumin-like fold domain-containing protein [Clostridium sp.]